MRQLASGEGGFGLVELLIAMTVMTIGIMAVAAGFSSGIIALNSASRTSTAGTLADKQMEAYRALPYTQIALKYSAVNAESPTGLYKTDAAYVGNVTLTGGTGGLFGTTLSTEYDGTYCDDTSHVTCTPVRATVPGPDGRSYRVDSFIVWNCAVGTLTTSGTIDAVTYSQASPGCILSGESVARPAKKVTVVVRDSATTSKTYVRETSTFDEST